MDLTCGSVGESEEMDKKILDVERASFTPLVFSSTGRMAKECTVVFKRLADMLAEKKMAFSNIMFLIRCKISFALLRSAIRAIRGYRLRPPPTSCAMIDFSHMQAETQATG